MARVGRPRYGAGLLLIRPSDGRILLLRRSPGQTKPGHWGVPGGGVEPGETELGAALREGREELDGLPEIHLAGVEPHWHAEGPFFAFAIFAADFLGDPDWAPGLNPENDAWGWFDPARLPTPVMPGTRAAAVDLIRRTVRGPRSRRPSRHGG